MLSILYVGAKSAMNSAPTCLHILPTWPRNVVLPFRSFAAGAWPPEPKYEPMNPAAVQPKCSPVAAGDTAAGGAGAGAVCANALAAQAATIAVASIARRPQRPTLFRVMSSASKTELDTRRGDVQKRIHAFVRATRVGNRNVSNGMRDRPAPEPRRR